MKSCCESEILKLVEVSERRGDRVLTNVMRLLESGGTSKGRRWEYDKQIAHFCRILGHKFLWHKVKNRRKRGVLFIAWQTIRGRFYCRKGKTWLRSCHSYKKKRIPSFLNDTMSDTFVVFPRFHIKIYRDKAKEEHISDRVHDKNCKL